MVCSTHLTNGDTILKIRYDSAGKNLWNPCMHLCNYSINKYHSDYIKCDDPDQEDQGHKWSLSALLRHLKANGIDTLQLMGSIEDVIIKVTFYFSVKFLSSSRVRSRYAMLLILIDSTG